MSSKGGFARKKGRSGAIKKADFVFDGRSGTPYPPAAETSPLSAYGRTKRDGERAILETLPSSGLIVRTAWLYSSHGHNFLLTMLKLMSERNHIKVVCDQHGTPIILNTFGVAAPF